MPKAWINASKTGYMQEIYKKPHSIAHMAVFLIWISGAWHSTGEGGGVDCCVLVFNVT